MLMIIVELFIRPWLRILMSSIAILILTLSSTWFASAQSFDCKLAQSEREHAVCSDRQLAAHDRATSDAYKLLRAQLSPESAAHVTSNEREWLRWLDLICPAHGKGNADNIHRCLAEEYGNRERDLKRLVHFSGSIIFLRAQFAYKPGGSTDEPAADNDPGFGYGTLRWPQIDILQTRPNPAYAAFNRAVEEWALQCAVRNDSKKKIATFDDAVEASGTVDGYYVVEAANDRFIDITFLDMTYGWGAAHPNTTHTSFGWWLDRERKLTAADVFLPKSGWQDKLALLTAKTLRSQDRSTGMLGDDIEEAVKRTVSNPANWSLTRDGLTVTFSQYSIGPYSMDMPQARIPWNALRSILTPDLEPDSLPAAIANRVPWAKENP
jgi:uncharacterized protein YecT (DUF1311 family)